MKRPTIQGFRLVVEARVVMPSGTVHVMRSPGLWNIESNADEAHFRQIASEEAEQLVADLTTLGVKVRERPLTRH